MKPLAMRISSHEFVATVDTASNEAEKLRELEQCGLLTRAHYVALDPSLYYLTNVKPMAVEELQTAGFTVFNDVSSTRNPSV